MLIKETNLGRYNPPPPQAQQPLMPKGLLVTEALRSHLDTQQSVRLLWDEWSARRRDLYLTTHNTLKSHTSMSTAGFEPTIPANKRPQTDALDRKKKKQP
jgi:hypothetical protein